MVSLWSGYFDNLSKYAKFTTLEQLNYAVYVSLKEKYVFVETAKVACSTIKLTLQRLELNDRNFSRENFQDVHDRAYSPLLKLQQIPNFEQALKNDNFFRFCFVRNPYTRTLSAYLDKILGNSAREKSIILSQLGHDMRDMSIHISFEEFISAIEKQPISMMDNHWRHQYYSTYQETIRYDFIGR
ncbi:MAG: sulfotransferase family 2 domain-containing protein, partial [Lutimonas sp.]